MANISQPASAPETSDTPRTETDRLARLAFVNEVRATHLKLHPLLRNKAKLPTPSITKTLALCTHGGEYQVEAYSWWAHPGTGKTRCIEFIRADLTEKFSGCGIFYYEPKATYKDREERSPLGSEEARHREFLASLLAAMGFDGKMHLSVTLREVQVVKGLLSRCLPSRHLFFIIDEAQEMDGERYAWLKTIVNRLTALDVQVNMLSFGQFELQAKRKEIIEKYRSDIERRMLGDLFEITGICSAVEMEFPLDACDKSSEYPNDSKIPFTEMIAPIAYGEGFRLRSIASLLWSAFVSVSPLRAGESSIGMTYVGTALATLGRAIAARDAAGLKVEVKDCEDAVASSRWKTRKPVQTPDGQGHN